MAAMPKRPLALNKYLNIVLAQNSVTTYFLELENRKIAEIYNGQKK